MALLSVAAVVWLALPDAWYLQRQAERAGLPREVLWAVAWQETRANLDPRVRGPHGERGRFQIMAATARRWCADLDIRTYKANVQCAVRILTRLQAEHGIVEAVRRYNGSGPRSRAYLAEVMQTVGRILEAQP